jgi:RNA polymerase sigma-70 factor (ECF subfamily)
MNPAGQHGAADFLDAALPHVDMLHTLARRLTNSREDAEDLVQEVMMRAYAAWHRQAAPRSMRAWLATSCLNGARSSGRKQQARPRELFDERALEHLSDPGDTELLALASIDADTVRLALQELSEVQRQVVTLINLCGFSTDQVARMLDLPRGTVLSRLHRGHRALAASLADRIPR